MAINTDKINKEAEEVMKIRQKAIEAKFAEGIVGPMVGRIASALDVQVGEPEKDNE